MSMANMRSHGEFNRVRVKLLGRGRSPDATRVLLARVFGDRLLRIARAPGVELTDPPRECFNVRRVELPTPSGGTFARGFAGIGI